MSDEKQERPTPELQPMKIVDTGGPMPVLGMPAQATEVNLDVAGPNVSSHNPKGVRLVMGKREIEAKKRLAGLKSGAIVAPPVINNPVLESQVDDTLQLRPAPGPKAAPNSNIPYVFPEAAPGTTTFDRNAKKFRNINNAPEYDEQWLEIMDGAPVSRAWLQTAVSISGFINSEASFNSQQIHGLTMVWNNGLYCKIKNNNGSKCFFVPEANIKILEFR